MMNLLILLAVLGLVVYGLERNHRRTRPGRITGSTNFENRDAARAEADLQAHGIAGRR
ncbi:hypothetical protein [Amycolatopsis sp.]|uniref:hypothetical protein n=1 Tax=Amycolatopsis sp. TaxID=37632 RepID=UPI002C2D3D25|nr:hypothetical protein [Amycolatopsis sp.]HVV08527.1 hypothetical protein [Amycolatopsis sp.]